MGALFKIVALIVMAAVAVVLILGLRSMLRGDSGERSNKLMQLRIALQAVAVLLIVLTLVYSQYGHS